MNTISKIIAISSLAFGCASAQVGRNATPDLRGAVSVKGPSVKAVVAGPVDIHAYSAFAGGTIYTVPAVAGGDADCQAAGSGKTVLDADRVHVMHIEAGQVACLATVKKGSFELLWHGHEQPATAVEIATARR
jgi:hypothetical protein